jgi:serine/threonine protein kinase
MGTVYAATDPSGRRIAVKAVHAHQAADPQFRARFHREVQVLRRVRGTCLVSLLYADPAAEIPWLATDYIPGPTLHQHLAAHGPLAGVQLHLFAAGTASALTAIHAAGVVHRDLKPANVILSPQGPRVLDFGIAHVADGTAVTRTGVMTGTPGWISPEYYRDGVAGAPGDVFAWGALVAYAATGRLPFGTGAPDAVAFRVMSGQADLGGVPEALLGVVESCLAKDPAHRPPAEVLAEKTAELLGRQATQVLGSIHDRPTDVQGLIADQWHMPTIEDPTWATAAARSRRKRTAWVAAAALVAFTAAATGTWIVASPGKARARTTATASATNLVASSSPAPAAPVSAAAPTRRSSAPSPTPSPPLSATKVNTIAPWSNGFPADNITITGDSVGTCWTPAESTMRLDAWRCTAESQILDPCFAPDVNPADTVLLCMGTSPSRMVRLTVTQPLPGNNDHMPGGPPINPVIIVLADGNTCRVMTGATTVLAGDRENYGCDKGGALYGYPNKTSALWTISYRPDGAGASSSTPIATVYQ